MFLRCMTLSCCAFVAACHAARAEEAVPASVLPLVEHVRSHRDGRAAWSIEFAALQRERAVLPIGVFDSGIGGLTVMEALLRMDAFDNETLRPGADGRPDFAGERFIYFGDQANMPYGNYAAQGREDFLHELISKDAVFLLGTRWRTSATAAPRFDKLPVKAIVIACNTATAYGLEDVRAALQKWELDVPVIGVVEAGARAVAESLPDDGRPHGVAVLATVGTCATKAYPKAIGRATGRAGKSAPVVVQQGSVGLAGAIEGSPAFLTDAESGRPRTVPYAGPSLGNAAAPLDPARLPMYHFSPEGMRMGDVPELNSISNYAHYDVTTLLETHLHGGGPAIDTVVLGCTHFPLVRAELADAFRSARNYEDAEGRHPYGSIVADEVRFIDPAESSAKELFRELARQRLRNRTREAATPPGATFFLSVPNPASSEVKLAPDGSLAPEYKVGRAPGALETEDTVTVPLLPDTLPVSSAKLVQALPSVWREIQRSATGVPGG